MFRLSINGYTYSTLVVSQELIDKFGLVLPQNNKSRIIENVFDNHEAVHAVAEFFRHLNDPLDRTVEIA